MEWSLARPLLCPGQDVGIERVGPVVKLGSGRRRGKWAGALALVVAVTATPVRGLDEAASGADSMEVVLGLDWENRAALDELVVAISNPQSPQFNRFLSAHEFERSFAPTARTVRAAQDYLRANGLAVSGTSASGGLIRAVGAGETVRGLLSDDGRAASAAALESMGVRGRLFAVDDDHEAQLRAPSDRIVVPPQAGMPFRPSDVARFYDFQGLYDAGVRGERGRHATIAIATAFGFSASDLQRFWLEFAIDRALSSVETIAVTGPVSEQHAETALDVQWASAMAPGSRVLVYAAANAGTGGFLAVYDRIVSDNRAAVLTTSWGACERELSRSYLEQADAIFERAAAQGITVIAASGDSGAFGCEGSAPGVSFPASSPHVLAVGGTTAQQDEQPVSEIAWQGSGGGMSTRWAAPPWQMQPEEQRAMADIALNADPATPYLAAYEDGWWYFGGTSVGAPIWAALVALANQRRAARSRPTLGLAAPALCDVALAFEDRRQALNDIVDGDNQMYAAGPGWDPPTGWGTPRGFDLVRALAEWTPPSAAVHGERKGIALRAAAADVAGRARVLFRRRCLSTEIRLRLLGVLPGVYTLRLDGEPAASFAAGARGDVLVRVPNADARGCRLTVNDTSGRELFAGALDQADQTRVQIAVDMTSRGAAQAATATLYYRSIVGHEDLTILARNLPAGDYEVAVGGTVIGVLRSFGDGASSSARFDSEGGGRALLPLSPGCRSVSVLSNGVALLRTPASALAIGSCQAPGS
jgi:kumamolisin